MRYLKANAQDRNGVADKADKELIRSLCKAFLTLAWYEQ